MSSDKPLVSERFPRSAKYHPEWVLASVGAGLMREIEGPPPEHLREWWTPDLWCLHSADLVAPALGTDRYRGRGGGRQGSVQLSDHIDSVPMQYTKKPLLRSHQ
jgi:hypothetical protein